MSANPSALVRLVKEFTKAEKDAVNAGIFAAKSGYHNTRSNHQRGVNGGKPSDYSIQAAADKRGPANKAAATDITFRSAQRGDFRIIAKYTKRLINAMKARDKRLFYKGKAVVRECFGNADNDRQVEGWSLYRGYAVSSDPSHLWHIHISFHREFVENWEAVKGVLDVLLDRKSPQTPREEDELNATEKKQLAEVHKWLSKLHKNQMEIGSLRVKDSKGKPEMHAAGYYLAHAEEAAKRAASGVESRVIPALQTLFAKVDGLAARQKEYEKKQKEVDGDHAELHAKLDILTQLVNALGRKDA